MYFVIDKRRGNFPGDYGAYYGGHWIKINYPNRFDAPREMVINQRASFLVMGPLLARFGQAACCSPGGDVIGSGQQVMAPASVNDADIPADARGS